MEELGVYSVEGAWCCRSQTLAAGPQRLPSFHSFMSHKPLEKTRLPPKEPQGRNCDDGLAPGVPCTPGMPSITELSAAPVKGV